MTGGIAASLGYTLEQVFQELAQPIYRFMLRLSGDEHVAADLTQEAFARAWKYQEQLRDAAAVRTWVFRIAHNVWRDQTASKAMEASWEKLPDNPTDPREAPPLDQIVCHELGQQIWEEIAKLPARQRQVMHLRAVEQMEIAEIADVLSISRQLVRSNLAVARKRLKAKFASHVPNDTT